MPARPNNHWTLPGICKQHFQTYDNWFRSVVALLKFQDETSLKVAKSAENAWMHEKDFSWGKKQTNRAGSQSSYDMSKPMNKRVQKYIPTSNLWHNQYFVWHHLTSNDKPSYRSCCYLTASISPARAESSMSCKTLTSVTQVTGWLPLPNSHSLDLDCSGICKPYCWSLT